MTAVIWWALASCAIIAVWAALWLTREGDKAPAFIPIEPFPRGTKIVDIKQPRRAPTREEFAAWRDDPLTQFVMAALARNADECADKWFNDSWQGGVADQRQLDGLRERADALRGIAEANYDAFCETLGLEPQGEENAA